MKVLSSMAASKVLEVYKRGKGKLTKYLTQHDKVTSIIPYDLSKVIVTRLGPFKMGLTEINYNL